MNKDEQWRPCPGYEHVYAVSNYGRVMRYAIIINRINSRQPNCKPLKQVVGKNGYGYLVLCSDISRRTTTIHKLVALAFIGPRPEGFDINHKDGNKGNNHVSNLEYITHLENMRHAIRTGLMDHIIGEGHPKSKLNKAKVLDIRKRASSGEDRKVIAAHYDLHIMTIHKIIRRSSWKSVS